MKIRKLKKQDVREIAQMLANYWKERGMSYSQKWVENYIKQGHKKEIKTEFFLVAEENKQIIGYISIVVYVGNVAELRDLVLKPEFRSKGLGKQVVKNALDICKKSKVRKVYALAFPKKAGFLKSLGFSKEGYLKNHFKKGEDLLFLSKFL